MVDVSQSFWNLIIGMMVISLGDSYVGVLFIVCVHCSFTSAYVMGFISFLIVTLSPLHVLCCLMLVGYLKVVLVQELVPCLFLQYVVVGKVPSSLMCLLLN